MKKSEAKEIIDIMFKDKDTVPKADVFKIIDMIDESTTINYPTNYPWPGETPKVFYDGAGYNECSDRRTGINECGNRYGIDNPMTHKYSTASRTDDDLFDRLLRDSHVGR